MIYFINCGSIFFASVELFEWLSFLLINYYPNIILTFGILNFGYIIFWIVNSIQYRFQAIGYISIEFVVSKNNTGFY